MTYVIAQPCVDVQDRACLIECPVDCIYEGNRTLYINPSECVDCRACEPVCPVEAIYSEEDLPRYWAQYTTINAEYFRTTSAQQAEPFVVDDDHRLIAELPPQTSHKKDIAAFSIRKEEAADADLWFPF